MFVVHLKHRIFRECDDLGKITVGFGRSFSQVGLPFWQTASPTAPPPAVSELLSGDPRIAGEVDLRLPGDSVLRPGFDCFLCPAGSPTEPCVCSLLNSFPVKSPLYHIQGVMLEFF